MARDININVSVTSSSLNGTEGRRYKCNVGCTVACSAIYTVADDLAVLLNSTFTLDWQHIETKVERKFVPFLLQLNNRGKL